MRNKDYIERAKIAAYNSLSDDQIFVIESYLTTIKRKEIAEIVGVPEVRLKRAAAYAGWHFTATKGIADKKYPKSTVKDVCKYYEKNGKRKTQKKFPSVRVRSIVERYYNGDPRQSRWTDKQLLELVKMAGIVNFDDQAQYFKRPRANKGSITAAWQKKFNGRAGCIHGLPTFKAKYFIKGSCPSVRTGLNNGVKLFLWCDCVHYFKNDCPYFIKKAIRAMAKFQIKLFGKNPRGKILRILDERSK